MRELDFIVNGQSIKKSPSCDFTNLVIGSNRYLEAVFNFDQAWDGCIKAVSFIDICGKETGVLLSNDRCEIPEEVTAGMKFYISVTGRRADGYQITTNRSVVRQEA